MKMWIQQHDFTSEEVDGATKEQAKKALATFDWQSEILKEKESKEETCPSGLGLISDSNEILHICPRASESCLVHYHYSTQKKLLGFIPVKNQGSHFVESCSIAKAMDLIDHHFDGNQEEILKIN
ncbi:hypothetical protein [Pontiella desulfatans]|uniref:hypothetical protein n=1 Tax=Pontiella desulfatans TaxID=2750659 RepID=UPI00109D81D7|nr:hypothetical protein [Pontiella desulfatans]